MSGKVKTRGKQTETNKEPEKNLATLIKATSKEYGDGVIRQGTALPNMTYIPTDIFMLDMALLGGLPEGKMTLVYGNPSSGKSMLGLKCAASAQRKYPNSKVLYINVESELDKNWAVANGVDLDRLYEAQPDSGEQAGDLFLGAIEAEDVNFIILDSLANLVPQKEADGSLEDSNIGLAARLQSRMFRNLRKKMNAELRKGHKVSVYCINQFRTNIGMMFGDPRVLPGGSGQHFAADVKLEMVNKEIIDKDTGVIQQNQHSFKVTKNKTGTSLRTGEFIVNRLPSAGMPVGAVDEVDSVLAYAVNFGLAGGAGQSWHLENEKFKSKAEIIEMLYNTPDRLNLLKKQLIALQRRSMGLPSLPPDEYL